MPKKSLVNDMDVWKELGATTEQTGIQSLKQAKIIHIERIHPNPHQPRKTLNQEALHELAESIRTHGLLQPIVVRPEEEDFLIIAGYRRYEACILAELTQIPCIIRDADEDETIEDALIENIQREDINPVEEAQCYQLLMEKHGYSIRDMAARVHKSIGYIHGRLELLKYPDIAQSVNEAQIGVFEARELAKIEDEEERRVLIKRIQAGELNRETLKKEVKKHTGKTQQLPLFDLQIFSRRWERLHKDIETFAANKLNVEEQQQTRQLLEEVKRTIERMLSQIE